MKLRLVGLTGVFAAAMLLPAQAAAAPETHDGFFMRFGLNLGPMFGSESIDFGGQSAETDFSGFTYGFDLLFGGAVVPGVIVGGGIISGSTSDPTLEQGGVEATADGTMLMIGALAFCNYYLDPMEGLHFQGLLGYGAVDFVAASGASGGNDPSGLMLGVGAGYDFWMSDEWSVAPFGRLMYGALGAEAGGATSSVSYIYPSIGVGLTYN